jgi:YegS/Rv2252/BmrU family lipid kinase
VKSTELTGKVCILLTRHKVPDAWRDNGAEPLRAIFEDAGYRAELELCDDPVAMNDFISASCERGDIVVIGGGDGTINAVIDTVIKAGVVMVPLPLGTANDFARSLYIPDDILQAARAAINGQIAMLDIGRVNGKSFVNAASIGVPADARKRIDPDLKRWTGAISYAVANWQSWNDMKPLELSVTCGDNPARNLKLRQLTVTNGQYFGGGLRPRENKRLDDGKLHMFAIQANVDTLSGMDIAAELLFGSVDDSSYAISQECDDIRLEGGEGEPILADGEIISQLPAHFTLEAKVLPVFAPNAFHGETDRTASFQDQEIVNDVALDALDLSLRLSAIYPMATDNQMKAICHDTANRLRDINRRLELALRPYDLPTSSPDPDLHSLEQLRDRAMSWMLADADMRLARGLKNQSVELGKTLDLCALDDIPGDISAPLKDMKELIGDLQQSLDEFQA